MSNEANEYLKTLFDCIFSSMLYFSVLNSLKGFIKRDSLHYYLFLKKKITGTYSNELAL